MSVSEELSRLAELRDKGLITDSEFEAQKAIVLGGGTTTPPPAAPPEKKAGAAKKGCAVLAGILALLIVIGLFAAPKSGTPTAATETAAPVAATAVTSVALAKAYEANEAAAQEQFGNRPLAVTGTVQGVQLGITDQPSVLLGGTNPFLHVQAALADASKAKASGLKKGQAVTLTCASVSEVIGTPMLAECEI